MPIALDQLPDDIDALKSLVADQLVRKKLPETLPRVEVIHDLPDDERVCPHDGNPLTEIGEVTSEQLDIIPAKIQVIRHVRKQYACSCG